MWSLVSFSNYSGTNIFKKIFLMSLLDIQNVIKVRILYAFIRYNEIFV